MVDFLEDNTSFNPWYLPDVHRLRKPSGFPLHRRGMLQTMRGDIRTSLHHEEHEIMDGVG